MPSGKKETLHSRTASTTADLDPKWVVHYWQSVETCLRQVFGKSQTEAHKATLKMQARTKELPEPTALLLYHDSPLQIASILAGASHRELTEQELLAYDKLWDPNMKDRPSREEILKVHRHTPRAG
jgi:hypothetical protein